MARIAVALFCGLATVACAAEDASLALDTSAVTSGNKLASNKLASNRLASNKLASNKLASNRLASNRLTANRVAADALLATADGREVLATLVSCALPDGVTLVAEADGVTHEFPGRIGLAESWLHRPLDRVDRGWVSACVLARVNAHGVSVLVSLRGPHRALDTGAEERAAWSLEEGAFYGNLFTPEGAPIDWHVCRGRDQAAGEHGDLVDRDCTEPDPADPTRTRCGFAFAGDCGRFAPRHACKHFSSSGGYYRGCRGGALEGDGPDDDDDPRAFRQVVTTYVRP